MVHLLNYTLVTLVSAILVFVFLAPVVKDAKANFEKVEAVLSGINR